MLRPTAAAPRRAAVMRLQRGDSAASASPGRKVELSSECKIRAHPQIAHDHGNSFSGSEAAHSATTERNLRINACTGLHWGATPPPIATAKGQPAVQAPQWVLRGPNEGERATKKLFAVGTVKRKLPSPPRHEENSACERAGVSARAHRKRSALTRSTGLTSRANGLRAARVCAARAASAFTALVPALCAPKAGALPRKFRRSSHSTAVTARKLQLHSHAQHAGPSTFNASPNRASDYSPLCPRSLRR